MNDDDIDPVAFAEAFRSANANPEYIAAMIADFITKMMRGALSSSPYGNASEATQLFSEIIAMLERMPPEHHLFSCIRLAERRLAVESSDVMDSAFGQAAADGTRCYLDLVATDDFQHARLSRSKDRFRASAKEMVAPRT